MSNDYIPRNDADFNNWFENITRYVSAKTTGVSPEWPHIMRESIEELNKHYAAWHAAYAVTLESHTPADTASKKNARSDAESVIRPFVQRFLHWPPVTDSDRVNMNIPTHSTTRTPHFEVTDVVEFELNLRHIREVLVDFWVKGSTNKAKPQGHDGAVIVWDVLDSPPKHPQSLSRHALASRTPFSLQFDETERGKTVYIAMAWQNERGNMGQWSEVHSAVVP